MRTMRKVMAYPADAKKVRFTLELERSLHGKVVAQAEREGKNRAEFIRDLCRHATVNTKISTEDPNQRLKRPRKS